ncbi:MAG: sigma-70 family RNA polymerase sigma factor [Sedimentisphaerales bacterium]|nr:sigma-70 family RNA polymerase sigma factor [Sedimentisphaerales bacterium]
MSKHDQTSMGGERDAFLTTHWSLIEDVKEHKDKDRALIGLLIKRYWKPVYCYLRRKGYDNEQAKDLTQGFLHEVVLNRRLVERAESSKGRFRSFLLHALNQYLLDERRKEAAQKHIPKDKLVPLDMADPPTLPQRVGQLDAEQSFNYVWKADLLERALAEVRERYAKQGMEKHWHVFQARLLSPTLEGRDQPSLSEICRQYDIGSEATASNMLNTVKKLIRSVLKSHVRQTVVSGALAEEELKEIFKFLEKEGKN